MLPVVVLLYSLQRTFTLSLDLYNKSLGMWAGNGLADFALPTPYSHLRLISCMRL
jgi:hypothetical protein